MKVLELETYTIDKKVYKHESNSIVATEKMMMKNSSETVVEKKYIKKNLNKTGNIFKINTLSEIHGKESASGKLSTDLNALIHNISVGTTASGELQTIYNMPEVMDKWDVLKKRWKKEATKENKDQVQKTINTVEENLTNGSFIKNIASQGVLHLLLNGLYNNYDENDELVIEKDLNKFLVTQALPLNITYKIIEYNRLTKAMVIEGKGEVAEERLDKKELTKLIRILKDKINLKVDLQVTYKERFEFDQHHWLTKAVQKVKVKIPGFYMAETDQKIEETNYEQ